MLDLSHIYHIFYRIGFIDFILQRCDRTQHLFICACSPLLKKRWKNNTVASKLSRSGSVSHQNWQLRSLTRPDIVPLIKQEWPPPPPPMARRKSRLLYVAFWGYTKKHFVAVVVVFFCFALLCLFIFILNNFITPLPTWLSPILFFCIRTTYAGLFEERYTPCTQF